MLAPVLRAWGPINSGLSDFLMRPWGRSGLPSIVAEARAEVLPSFDAEFWFMRWRSADCRVVHDVVDASGLSAVAGFRRSWRWRLPITTVAARWNQPPLLGWCRPTVSQFMRPFPVSWMATNCSSLWWCSVWIGDVGRNQFRKFLERPAELSSDSASMFCRFCWLSLAGMWKNW